MKINEKGFWMNDTQEGHANDNGLSLALIDFFEKLNLSSMVDLGCGPGFYLSKFKAAGYVCDGFDGNPYTEQLTQGLAKVADLSEKLFLNTTYDCVLSLEVGEHIPEDCEQIFIDNICRHSNKYVILSWAVPGQNGDGHVNCRSNDYIETSFKTRGFSRLFDYERALRASAEHHWFKNTLMVFSKQQAIKENAVTFDSYKDFKGYVINLDREYWRYIEARKKLCGAGFTNLSRLSAVDYKEKDVSLELRRLGAKHLERYNNDAEIACTLSHFKVMYDFLAGKEEYCLVFEDDALPVPDFKKHADFNDVTYGDFDLLSFGGIYIGPTDAANPIWTSENVAILKAVHENKSTCVDNVVFLGSHAYMLSRKGAYQLLQEYKQWLSSEEYRYPQLDRYISGLRAIKNKLAVHTPANLQDYSLGEYFGDFFRGIIFQRKDFPSLIRNT